MRAVDEEGFDTLQPKKQTGRPKRLSEMQREEIKTVVNDVFLYLMSKGIDINLAYDISEYVRKGSAVSDKRKKWNEYSGVMKAADIPDWYIDSCKKIWYLFPRAHATAYAVMAMRLAYYKVHYRSEFDSVMINS